MRISVTVLTLFVLAVIAMPANAMAKPKPRPNLAASYVAPRTPAEQLVAGIYADVLRVERIGVDDDFLERGGHSLLATQAIVRVREVVTARTDGDLGLLELVVGVAGDQRLL